MTKAELEALAVIYVKSVLFDIDTYDVSQAQVGLIDIGDTMNFQEALESVIGKATDTVTLW